MLESCIQVSMEPFLKPYGTHQDNPEPQGPRGGCVTFPSPQRAEQAAPAVIAPTWGGHSLVEMRYKAETQSWDTSSSKSCDTMGGQHQAQ